MADVGAAVFEVIGDDFPLPGVELLEYPRDGLCVGGNDARVRGDRLLRTVERIRDRYVVFAFLDPRGLGVEPHIETLRQGICQEADAIRVPHESRTGEVDGGEEEVHD